ncbi:MAG: hypothetical protein QNJ45_29410 [Ardenticatenaceae bacterium]|nr:hypothetical protein [Ardenticatenaceae bacterium]
MLCEHCGFTRPVEIKKKESIQELITLRRMVSGSRIPENSMRSMLNLGTGAFNDGKIPVARSYFEQVILKTGDHEEEMEAWLGLATLVEDPAEKRLCLEAVLAINPANGPARKELALLDGRIDPQLLEKNSSAAAPDAPVTAHSKQMTCPQCTGAMRFEPEQQLMVCPFCHHTEDASAKINLQKDEQFGQGALEQDFDAAIHTVRGDARPVQMRLMQCQGCGTEFVLGAATLSVTCPYCSSVYVTEAAETIELIPPQGVIPFALTQDDAKQAVVRWFKERRITRQDISRVSPMSGMYIPVWTFDIGGEVQWHGKVMRGDQRSGQFKSVPAFNSKYIFFNDYAVVAMSHQNALIHELIKGYDFDQIVPYDPRLLADWPAERYTVALSDASNQARSRITKQIRRLPHGLAGGDKLDEKSIRCDTRSIIIESYKLLLLPVWTFHYLRKDRQFDLLINGQTGEVDGQDDKGMVAKLKRWFKG